MTERRDADGVDGPPPGAALRVVPGHGAADSEPPPVRLVREFRGPTVADLLRDEFAAQLPGRAWSALRRIEAGEFAAAEASLPGVFAPILPGPGGRSRRRRLRWLVAVAVVVLAVAAGAALLGGR